MPGAQQCQVRQAKSGSGMIPMSGFLKQCQGCCDTRHRQAQWTRRGGWRCRYCSSTLRAAQPRSRYAGSWTITTRCDKQHQHFVSAPWHASPGACSCGSRTPSSTCRAQANMWLVSSWLVCIDRGMLISGGLPACSRALGSSLANIELHPCLHLQKAARG